MANIPETLTFDVDALRLAALAWGPEDGTPVLALHGWMDHAGSFAELAPRLTGCRVVALDLSGQGLSAHRAAHASYNIWDDVPQIARVMDGLRWESCVLLGHSRGANISALFAAALPERTHAFVALDSLVPEPSSATIVETLRAHVQDVRKQTARGPRVFESRDAYVARRAAQGNSREVALALADRALAPSGDGVTMRGDGRMFASSAVKLDRDDVMAVIRAITCPVMNIWGETGIRSRPNLAQMVEEAAGIIPDYTSLSVPGDHHFHMDAQGADLAARAILSFLADHPSGTSR